ncbi:NAD(P)-dependent oxidoreductase [Saccharomonospora sp. CUA-673]|uniref:imine reductase family protein n=1 Tax=Saccharomonospora sp. CUA-673 TaxID=1904969 RepID=UPI000A9D5078
MDEILDGSEAELSGRTLINVSSDSPARTREAAEWAAGHGARLLVGGLMVPAPMLGTEAAFAYYSGPRADFDKAREVLALIAEPRYLGADPGLAQLMYQAHLDVFLTTLSALMHATALVGSAGVSAREFLPEVWPTVTGIPAMLSAGGDLGAEIDAGEHPGHLSTAAMMGATTDHIVAASEDAGIDLTLPHAVQGHYHRALADGHGTENWSRIIDGIRTPR